ncbi:nickel-dependent hydrogenase large subunit [Chlorobaculum parvum NCIB 8327]|uniref:Nickel-dependent hydrogenase large subunit n=1 Tax=Chlorobaculum parvum (strain DSM 263 / NCIMB 8327) TaxID=517417 RepID=B3QP46_CHLP8|nr:nickel-dependent hydrogenase large subunit [Chlorobaculum parvum]ACF11699.1 nickel-dependent hydrogenase large subunit [Chlorobaculum parvum NCIB 8327]
MSKKIVVDPIPRIEGHLRIEAKMNDANVIEDAYSTGTMWRGIEVILKGRDPRDAWAFAERICGVCTTVHALASVRCVEDALGIEIPKNARIIRNLMNATQQTQDHLVHFYHLHALDWVDVVSALKADPGQASAIAQSISAWPKSSVGYFKDLQKRLVAFVESGQLGIFSNGYWGHPAYKLPPEVNLIAVAHYLEALEFQKEIVKIQTIFGGKNPHPNYVVGGMACAIDPNSDTAINIERLSMVKSIIDRTQQFIDQVYIPDLIAIAGYYKGWLYGGGLGNFMSYGDFPETTLDDYEKLLWPRGVIMGKDLTTVLDVDPRDMSQIKEEIAHSWYTYSNGSDQGLHPWEGETNPKYTGPKPPFEYLDTDKKYSWLKTPRWKDQPVEVGPLARVLVAYAKGDPMIKDTVGMVLSKLEVGPEALYSTLGRTAARGIECKQTAGFMRHFYDELVANVKTGDYQTFNSERWEPSTWPKECKGFGYTEAPRGSLGHWIRIENGKIGDYQIVVPSTWNASPRDGRGNSGAYEAALKGTPMHDPSQPLEILRTVHSFDPCLACASHVFDMNGNEITKVRIV